MLERSYARLGCPSPQAVDQAWWKDVVHVVPRDEAVVQELETHFGQVRSRQRVRDLAEVFTHQREVDAMLDMTPMFTDPASKFLEPAAGNGNFLVEILRRKLTLVTKSGCDSLADYEHQILVALGSIYGIDISAENVADARKRMVHTLLEYVRTDVAAVRPTDTFLSAVALVLASNIVVGNTLTDQERLEFCDWQPKPGQRFVRIWSHALVPPAERGLFWAERVQDAAPVHYTELAEVASAGKRAQ